jgi:hypothetical protein
VLALAGAGGHRLEGVVGDHVQLVDDRQAGVPALQRAGVRGQREQGGIRVGFEKVILEDLDPGVQRRVELHHPPGGVLDDAGLPLVAGDADDLGALIAKRRRGDGSLGAGLHGIIPAP